MVEPLWRTSLEVSSKTKHRLSYGPAILPVDIYSREVTCIHTDLYIFTALFVHNSQKVEIAQLYTNRQRHEQIVLHPYKGTLLSSGIPHGVEGNDL